MDINDLEMQIEKINRQIEGFLNLVSEEEENQKQKIMNMLKGGLEIKETILDNIEASLNQMITEYEDKLKKIEAEIHQLENGKIKVLHNLDAKKEELEAKSNEDLRPYLINQKKKKTDLMQTINSFKRDLASFHKENNYRLIDEEKDYKAREVELNRRLNIDVEREIDANIKAYSDYEKALLDTDDEDQIFQLKEKIRKIRTSGLENIRNIRDKYAYSHFENHFNFHKYLEKIKLENSLKTEESKILVHALETEKEFLDREDNNTMEIAQIEVQKALLSFEKENALHQNKIALERKLEVLKKREEIFAQKEAHGNEVYKTIETYRNKVFTFDKEQVKVYAPLLEVFNSKTKTILEESLVTTYDYLLLLKEYLFSVFEKLLQEKKAANDSFKTMLLISFKEHSPHSSFSYQDLRLKITKATEVFHQYQRQKFEESKVIIRGIIDSMLKSIKDLGVVKENFIRESQALDEAYALEIAKILDDGSLLQKEMDKEVYIKAVKKQVKPQAGLRKLKASYRKLAKKNEAKIEREFALYERKLKEQSIKLEQDKKKTNEEIAIEDREFIKKCRQRMGQLHKNCTENVSNQEKALYALYKEEQERNLSEYKARLQEL